MSCPDCAYWGHKSCILPCPSKVPKNFEIFGLLLEPKSSNKLNRDSLAIFVSEKSTDFRDHCETESDLALLDHFCVKLLGKKIVNIDRQEFVPNVRNRDLFIVPKPWEQQYKALEKHYRALAKNGINRGVTYARNITRQINARESTNKESKFTVYF